MEWPNRYRSDTVRKASSVPVLPASKTLERSSPRLGRFKPAIDAMLTEKRGLVVCDPANVTNGQPTPALAALTESAVRRAKQATRPQTRRLQKTSKTRPCIASFVEPALACRDTSQAGNNPAAGNGTDRPNNPVTTAHHVVGRLPSIGRGAGRRVDRLGPRHGSQFRGRLTRSIAPFGVSPPTH